MSESLGPDPRLDGRTSIYNRDDVVRLITDFYQFGSIPYSIESQITQNRFLARMPFIEPEDILYPPSSGWSNITPEHFAPLGKTNTVIDLLAHLPYIRNQGRRASRNRNFATCLWFSTFALNYTDEYFQTEPVDVDMLGYTGLPPLDSEPVIPSHVAVWTEAETATIGHTYLIDTMDGTVTEYPVYISSDLARYPAQDPRSWRNECGKTMLLLEFLDELKQGYVELHWMPYWFRKQPQIYVRGFSNGYGKGNEEGLYKIMIAHGWPNEFRREECKTALLAWRMENESM